ncbi:hypothetical protein BD414DRAFT_486175 [Trametes punicea]|nr:hypothetical protein BD414DRAFT_486175 [Trametes punicea]
MVVWGDDTAVSLLQALSGRSASCLPPYAAMQCGRALRMSLSNITRPQAGMPRRLTPSQ